VRWVFVHHPDYAPVLAATGWSRLRSIGDVDVWTHPGVTQPVPTSPPHTDSVAAAWWGVAPLTILALSVATLGLEART
jgi:hypothetical protein